MRRKNLSGRCTICRKRAVIRFQKKNWCGECFEINCNTPDPIYIDHYLWTHSSAYDMELRGRKGKPGTSRLRDGLTAAMKAAGIPTFDPRERVRPE